MEKLNDVEARNKRRPVNKIYYYIGYTSRETEYLCNTSPKSEEWKKLFEKFQTYYAEIDGDYTERKLMTGFYRSPDSPDSPDSPGSRECVNKRLGNEYTEGYLYVLLGTKGEL